jgi:hypothetical protein
LVEGGKIPKRENLKPELREVKLRRANFTTSETSQIDKNVMVAVAVAGSPARVGSSLI